MDAPAPRDVDLASAAALFGDPARAAMLAALADGQALPAGELARRAGIRPATATAHLRRLIDGGLVQVRAQGRHRYHQLAGPQVAEVLEALARLAPTVEVRSWRQHRAVTGAAEARTCYDHLAGRRGVELLEGLLRSGVLRPDGERDYLVTTGGAHRLGQLGIDVDAVRGTRRVFARSCLDWTQRRPHLAGGLAAGLTERFFTLGWLTRGAGRALDLAPDYDGQVGGWLGHAGPGGRLPSP